MKIMSIMMLFMICQTSTAEGGGPLIPKGSDNGHLKQTSEQGQSTPQSDKNTTNLDQRRRELAEYACKGQSHGVPCSFGAGDGSRISGICYQTDKQNALFCRPSNYQKPSTPSAAPSPH
jgi:hypothetical protein